MGLTKTRTEVAGDTPETSSSLNIQAGAKLNRTEYGEFNSGLNGEVNTALIIDGGKVTGYNATLDGAWNYYGSDHDQTTDYLVRSLTEFGKENGTQNFSTELSGAYRINNCNTIFEVSSKYSTSSSEDMKSRQFSNTLGVYQQVGKKFGDATVFTQLEFGKKGEQTPETTSSRPFAQVSFGSEVQVAKKVSLNSRCTYDTGSKWNGEIGMRYTF